MGMKRQPRAEHDHAGNQTSERARGVLAVTAATARKLGQGGRKNQPEAGEAQVRQRPTKRQWRMDSWRHLLRQGWRMQVCIHRLCSLAQSGRASQRPCRYGIASLTLYRSKSGASNTPPAFDVPDCEVAMYSIRGASLACIPSARPPLAAARCQPSPWRRSRFEALRRGLRFPRPRWQRAVFRERPTYASSSTS